MFLFVYSQIRPGFTNEASLVTDAARHVQHSDCLSSCPSLQPLCHDSPVQVYSTADPASRSPTPLPAATSPDKSLSSGTLIHE